MTGIPQYDSADIHYWQNQAADLDFTITDWPSAVSAYLSDYVYSCSLDYSLQATDAFTVPTIITLTSSPTMKLTLLTQANKVFTDGTRRGLAIVPTPRQLTTATESFAGTSSSEVLSFELFIYPDCSNSAGAEVLEVPAYSFNFPYLLGDYSFLSVNQIDGLFVSGFAEDYDICPITMFLRSNLRPSSDTSVYTTEIYHEGQGTLTFNLIIEVSSNSQIVTYDALDNVACRLTDWTTEDCIVTFEMQVNSINGTAAIQNSGTITFESECGWLATRVAAT